MRGLTTRILSRCEDRETKKKANTGGRRVAINSHPHRETNQPPQELDNQTQELLRALDKLSTEDEAGNKVVTSEVIQVRQYATPDTAFALVNQSQSLSAMSTNAHF